MTYIKVYGPLVYDNSVNPLMSTLKLHSNGRLYSNTMIGTLAVDGWAVHLVQRGAWVDCGVRSHPVPSSLF